MFEEDVMDQMERSGVDLIVSLPCDKNKRFTDMIHGRFDVIDVTREEDGVGICAGAHLMGKRPMISIQSSGLGNMMNAMMSLMACYSLPLVIMASWRGVDGEKIEAQIPFNSRIPEMLDCFDVDHLDVSEASDIGKISDAMDEAYGRGRILVILMHPRLWGDSKRLDIGYPPRSRTVDVDIHKSIGDPIMTRLDAISAVMGAISDDDIVVSNIGVPSKEVFASRDRPLNFYMLGSYTQATPIGLGMAVSTDRRVVVIDGDGSLLGSSIFPVLSSVHPANLTVVCMDNGTFGSTGNQINQAYSDVDMGLIAASYGLKDVRTVEDAVTLVSAMSSSDGMRFLQVMISPGNSDSRNIPYSAVEIRDRFMGSL